MSISPLNYFTGCGRSYCITDNLGCCTSQNSSRNCAGPVHLTQQWDIGSRQCCPGAGKKYSSLGGAINYCSTRNGIEGKMLENRIRNCPIPGYKTPVVAYNLYKPCNPPKAACVPKNGKCGYGQCCDGLRCININPGARSHDTYFCQ
jgi:hypothetical protein